MIFSRMTARSTSGATPPAASYRPGALTAALVASLPFLLLLVVVPAHLYLGNMPYLDHNQMVILHLGVVYGAIVTILYLLTRCAASVRKPLAFGLGTLGVIFAVVYLISPSPIGELIDPGIPPFEEDTSWVLAEIAVLGVIGLAVRLIPIAQLMETVAIVCAALGVCLPALAVIETSRSDDSAMQWIQTAHPPTASAAEHVNIYHLVFDAYDGTLFEDIVNGEGMRESFAGFVHYSKALANYPSTRLSFPSFMTGRLFEDTITDNVAGQLGRREGLVKDLADIGYRVS